MEIGHIEKMIAECCGEEDADVDLRELLAVVADRNGIQPDDEELDRGSHFVVSYVEQVPYMLKVARTAAANVGLEEEMQQIMEMVLSYWLQDLDIIPDHLGLIGLLDDAYCSLTTLQAVSDHFRLQTGKFLFPDDLIQALSLELIFTTFCLQHQPPVCLFDQAGKSLLSALNTLFD